MQKTDLDETTALTKSVRKLNGEKEESAWVLAVTLCPGELCGHSGLMIKELGDGFFFFLFPLLFVLKYLGFWWLLFSSLQFFGIASLFHFIY